MQALDYLVLIFFLASLAVGTFTAEYDAAAFMSCIEIIKKRRARCADMEPAGGRRRNASDDLTHE